MARVLLSRLTVDKPDLQELHRLVGEYRETGGDARILRAGENWPTELPATAAQVEENLKALSKACDDECYTLGTAADDPNTLRRISAVLAVPLVTGRERNELREKYVGIMFLRQNQEATAAAAAPPEDQGLGREWLTRLTLWEKNDDHPAADAARSGGLGRRRK